MTSELLNSHLKAVRAKHVLVAVCTGLTMAVAVLVLWTGLEMWIDWNLTRGLPRWARATSLALELIVVAGILVFRIIQPIVRAPDDEDVALMIERKWPEFQSRMIASVQLTSKAAQAELAATHKARSLVGHMVRQTESLAQEIPLTDVVSMRTLNKAAGSAGLLVALAVFLFLFGMPATTALLNRALLGNAARPSKTHIEFVSGNMNVALGDQLKITAKVSGYKPATGTIEIAFPGRNQRFIMDREPGGNNDTYTFKLDAVQESFTYSVVLYDSASDDFKITALPRPAVHKFECTQMFPKYTGKEPEPCSSSELVLLRGSTLRVSILSTKDVRENPADPGDYSKVNYVLLFTDTGGAAVSEKASRILLNRNPKNLKHLWADIPLPENVNALSVHLVDTKDLESKETAVYPVEMVPDRAPTVKILWPDRKEVLQTAIAKMPVGFDAQDDYLLGTLTLRYKLTDDEGGSVQAIPLEIPGQRKDLRGTYLWDLGKIPPPPGQPSLEGSVIEYWVEVADTRDDGMGGANRGASEHYAIRVVTAAAKQAELLARSGATIGDIREAEEHQNMSASKTAIIIKELNGGQTPPPPNQP